MQMRWEQKTERRERDEWPREGRKERERENGFELLGKGKMAKGGGGKWPTQKVRKCTNFRPFSTLPPFFKKEFSWGNSVGRFDNVLQRLHGFCGPRL